MLYAGFRWENWRDNNYGSDYVYLGNPADINRKEDSLDEDTDEDHIVKNTE